MEELIYSISKVLLVLSCCQVYFAQSFAKTLESEEDKIDLSHLGSRLFGNPIENDAKTWNDGKGNPEERGSYLQGDLLITLQGRNGMKSESLRWKNAEVPFEIHGSFSKFCDFSKMPKI